MKSHYFIVLMAFLWNMTALCMHLISDSISLDSNSIRYVVSFLDFSSAASFFKTCKNNYTLYDPQELAKNPLDYYLLTNEQQCLMLSSIEHTNICVRYAQLGDEVMMKHVITHESDMNRNIRMTIQNFFNRDNNRDDVKENINTYKGFSKDQQIVASDALNLAVRYWTTLDKIGAIKIEAILNVLLKNGANVNHFGEMVFGRRWTPLHHAVHKGWLRGTHLLLKWGACVNIADEEGDTPLHVVDICNSTAIEIIRLLIKAGADINAKNKYNDTILLKAMSRHFCGHGIDMIHFLLKNGANGFTIGPDGECAFEIGAQSSVAEIEQLCSQALQIREQERLRDQWQREQLWKDAVYFEKFRHVAMILLKNLKSSQQLYYINNKVIKF